MSGRFDILLITETKIDATLATVSLMWKDFVCIVDRNAHGSVPKNI